MTEKLTFRQALEDDISKLWAFVRALGQEKEAGYFERCLERQGQGDLVVLIAALDGEDVGYALLNWVPKYPLYKRLGIPEIQDLNVMQAYRRRGIATQIIAACEERARDAGKGQMGIAVSVHGAYGPAQRLYVSLGYVPDGYGVSYDRHAVDFAAMRPIDDQLCLMMVKDL